MRRSTAWALALIAMTVLAGAAMELMDQALSADDGIHLVRDASNWRRIEGGGIREPGNGVNRPIRTGWSPPHRQARAVRRIT